MIYVCIINIFYLTPHRTRVKYYKMLLLISTKLYLERAMAAPWWRSLVGHSPCGRRVGRDWEISLSLSQSYPSPSVNRHSLTSNSFPPAANTACISLLESFYLKAIQRPKQNRHKHEQRAEGKLKFWHRIREKNP